MGLFHTDLGAPGSFEPAKVNAVATVQCCFGTITLPLRQGYGAF